MELEYIQEPEIINQEYQKQDARVEQDSHSTSSSEQQHTDPQIAILIQQLNDYQISEECIAKARAEYPQKVGTSAFKFSPLQQLGYVNTMLGGDADDSQWQKAQRLAKEYKCLQRALPTGSENSIFVRVDEENQNNWMIVIQGAEGTYYENGLYEFNMAIPQQYPSSPPKMNLCKSTGFHFGPNLYRGGYVCLSIIGTWGGDPEESWSSDKNILQILLSIQGLVMDNCIAAKEPGCEYYAGEEDYENLIYGWCVRVGNVKYAMNEVMKYPPVGMEDIVYNHFYIKRDIIRQTFQKWLDQADRIDFKTNPGQFSMHYNNDWVAYFQASSYRNVLQQEIAVCLQLLQNLEAYMEGRTDKFDTETNLPTINYMEQSQSQPNLVQQETQEIVEPVEEFQGDFNAMQKLFNEPTVKEDCDFMQTTEEEGCLNDLFGTQAAEQYSDEL